MGLFFYPRGGSARGAGYLSRALGLAGWPVTLACGSLGAPGALGNAESVFAGVDIVAASYDDAVARWARGEDPMDAPFPMHPSFEARSGVPDRSFPWVSPAQGERMAMVWAGVIARSDAMARARVLHLHHLTPVHDCRRFGAPWGGTGDSSAWYRAQDARCDRARGAGNLRAICGVVDIPNA
jgi:hypothetical protein